MKRDISTVTFLFTDIEGSTRLWDNYPEGMRTAQQWHDIELSAIFESHGGIVFRSVGDGLCVSFDSPSSAVAASVAAQCLLNSPAPPTADCIEGLVLRVRMAIHTTEIEREGDNYFGIGMSRVARLLSAAHGGQVLVSEATRVLTNLEAQGIRFTDLGSHMLKDVGMLRFFQVLHPNLLAVFPPPSLPLTVSNRRVQDLPLSYASFIGRAAVVDDAVEALQSSDVRVVTLTGFGGVGKTRAAVHIAELCAQGYAYGALWVPLDSVRTGQEMVSAIARGLGVEATSGISEEEQVWRRLHNRELLVVLDNTEQISEASQVIRELLRRAEQVKCLVTSRKRLNLRAERCIELAPLDSIEAVELFLERANGVSLSIKPGKHDPDVIHLCEVLEVIPLAIELAAAQTLTMTPRQIVNRIAERIDLLEDSSQDLPVRQQTLFAAIEWSYLLLSESVRTRFVQLAVFGGSFTLEDAESVFGVEGTLRAIQEARNHSLLVANMEAARGAAEYKQLQVVRLFASSLATGTLREEMDEKHGLHYLSIAGVLLARLRGAEQERSIEELERIHTELLAAREWAENTGRSSDAAVIALALHHSLNARGRKQQATDCLNTVLVLIERDGLINTSLAAVVLIQLGGLAYDCGDYIEARRKADHARISARLCSDLDIRAGKVLGIEAEAINLLALVSRCVGDFDESERQSEIALQMVGAQDYALRGMLLNNLALTKASRRQIDDIGRLYEEALTCMRSAGYARGEAEVLQNIGMLAHTTDEVQAAQQFYRQSLALYVRTGYTLGVASLINNLGEMAELLGEPGKAVLAYVHADRLLLEMQSPLAHVASDNLRRLQSSLAWEDMVEYAESARKLQLNSVLNMLLEDDDE